MPEATRIALDELLLPVDSATEQEVASTPLHQIRTCRVKASLNSVLQAVVQLEKLQQINLPPDLFASVSPKIVFRFRQRAAVEVPSKLRRHPAPIRYTLLAAFCLCRSAEITDDLVECLNILVHKMGTRAERRIYKELLEDLKRVSGKNNLLFQIAEASLLNPDGSVKEVIYPVMRRRLASTLTFLTNTPCSVPRLFPVVPVKLYTSSMDCWKTIPSCEFEVIPPTPTDIRRLSLPSVIFSATTLCRVSVTLKTNSCIESIETPTTAYLLHCSTKQPIFPLSPNSGRQ